MIKKLKKVRENKFVHIPLTALESVRGRVTTAISAALAFVIALSWNDAIKQGTKKMSEAAGLTGDSYFYTLLSTIFITAIALFGIFLLSKFAINEKK